MGRVYGVEGTGPLRVGPPSGTCDPVTSVMPDRQGRIWWVTGLGGPGDGRRFCR